MNLDNADVDTASAVAVLGFLGGNLELCTSALDSIIRECEAGHWQFLDIPIETWEGLANLFRCSDEQIGARKARFLTLLEAAVAESFESIRESIPHDVRALAPFWVQALRIGAVSSTDRIFVALNESLLPRIPEHIGGWERKCILSLIGWARESGNPSPMLTVLRGVGDGVWLTRFLGDSGERWNPRAVDDEAVARILTHQEAMDLRWALGLLQKEDHKRGR